MYLVEPQIESISHTQRMRIGVLTSCCICRLKRVKNKERQKDRKSDKKGKTETAIISF